MANKLNKGAIRIHESGDAVHFHDDVAKIKTVVPIAVFFDRWRDFRANPVGKSLVVEDAQNGSRVILEGIREDDQVDIKLRLECL